MIFAPKSFQLSTCSESQALNTSLIYFHYNSLKVKLKKSKLCITFLMFENTIVETVTKSHNYMNIGTCSHERYIETCTLYMVQSIC